MTYTERRGIKLLTHLLPAEVGMFLHHELSKLILDAPELQSNPVVDLDGLWTVRGRGGTDLVGSNPDTLLDRWSELHSYHPAYVSFRYCAMLDRRTSGEAQVIQLECHYDRANGSIQLSVSGDNRLVIDGVAARFNPIKSVLEGLPATRPSFDNSVAKARQAPGALTLPRRPFGRRLKDFLGRLRHPVGALLGTIAVGVIVGVILFMLGMN